MKELSSQARGYLDALRSVDAPPSEASARVWDGVVTRAAAGELGPELGPEPPIDAGTLAGSSSIKTIVIAVAVAAAAIGATAAVVLGGDDAPVLAARPGLAPMRGLPAPVAAAIEPPAEEAPPEIDEASTTEAAVPIAAPARPSARTPVRATKPAVAKPSVDPVAEEVALLAEARSALGAGEASRAIGLLARHRKRFPDGLLARERDVSWITALCVLGRADEARKRADSFLRAHGSSPHAAKVRASCGGRDE